MKQQTFASLTYQAKKKQTRREKFLAEMERVVPWSKLNAVVEPHYPKAGRRGRPPMPLMAMLRIYCLQQWYAMSDPAMEDALYEIESMRRIAGLELVEDAIPDQTTILKFRRLLERHELTSKMMNVMTDTLEERGLLIQGGTMMAATIIHASVDEEQEQIQGPGDAPDEERQPMVLWDEGPCGCRCEHRGGAYGFCDPGQCFGHQPVARITA